MLSLFLRYAVLFPVDDYLFCRKKEVQVRVTCDVWAGPGSISFDGLHAPGRTLVYRAMSEFLSESFVEKMHSSSGGLVPFGFGPPVFSRPKRVPGKWGVGGPGLLVFGSPRHDVSWSIAKFLESLDEWSWDGVPFRLESVKVEAPKVFSEGRAFWTSASPVVAKRPQSGIADDRRFLVPDDDDFEGALTRNAQKKAGMLGLPEDVTVSVLNVGKQRLRSVTGALRVGTLVDVEVAGHPDVLSALYDWGVGESNSAGFGWVQ